MLQESLPGLLDYYSTHHRRYLRAVLLTQRQQDDLKELLVNVLVGNCGYESVFKKRLIDCLATAADSAKARRNALPLFRRILREAILAKHGSRKRLQNVQARAARGTKGFDRKSDKRNSTAGGRSRGNRGRINNQNDNLLCKPLLEL